MGAHRPDPGHKAAEVKVKVTQSCLNLCYPMDYTVHGILQARMLDWVAFPFSRGSSQHKAMHLSPVPASMTYKLQRTIWAWSPEPWAAGGYDPGYYGKSFPAPVLHSRFTLGPALISCPPPGGGRRLGWCARILHIISGSPL